MFGILNQMKLNVNNFDVAIFDIDGTMVDNMNYHLLAWQHFCQNYNIELTKEEFQKKLSGHKNEEYFDILFKKSISEDLKLKLAEEKEEIYRSLYKPYIKEVNGLKKLLGFLKSHHIICAIATTSPLENRQLILDELNVAEYFSLVLGEEDTTKGKPDPEIYLKVAEKLKAKRNRCIVFEDSPAGVKSAKRAGMQVVALLTTHTEEQLNTADCFINDFLDIDFVGSSSKN